MTVVLSQNSYGKSRVRLCKVERHTDHHDLFEWTIDIRLTGDFASAYTDGDNRQVVATDTIRNVVYAFAADAPLRSPEDFASRLCQHYLKYSQVVSSEVQILVEAWDRVVIDNQPHAHAFVGGKGGNRTCKVTATRTTGERTTTGLSNLLVLKTTDSSWKDFHRDEYRTLADCDDRILATNLTAAWTYAGTADWDAAFRSGRSALIETFSHHKSLGAQHTLFALGEAVLAAIPEADEITISMPNQHRIPFDLVPFGRANSNSVFVATDEPHGLISGTIRRV